MNAPPDYYRILCVEPDAPPAIIHTSYRTLLERARAAGQAADIAMLDEAYAVLGDHDRRTTYDVERARGVDPFEHHRPEGPEGSAPARNCLFCGATYALERRLERDDECGACLSPLFPAERHRLEYSGQRMIRRVPKRRAVEVRVTWPQPEPHRGEMRDLSLNGMLFVTTAPLQPDQIVRVDCTELRALGRVAHVAPDPDGGGTRTGIQFLTLRFSQVRGSFVSVEA